MVQGKVPMFKMRPQMSGLWMAVFVILIGVAAYYNGQRQLGDPEAQKQGLLVLMISITIGGGLIIVATGRMWFRHLWHDRYKKSILPWKN
jgi:uncharacterized membrane-anchored protein